MDRAYVSSKLELVRYGFVDQVVDLLDMDCRAVNRGEKAGQNVIRVLYNVGKDEALDGENRLSSVPRHPEVENGAPRLK